MLDIILYYELQHILAAELPEEHEHAEMVDEFCTKAGKRGLLRELMEVFEEIPVIESTTHPIGNLNLPYVGIPEKEHLLLGRRDVDVAVDAIANGLLNIAYQLFLTIVGFVLLHLSIDIVVSVELTALGDLLILVDLLQQVFQKAGDLAEMC